MSQTDDRPLAPSDSTPASSWRHDALAVLAISCVMAVFAWQAISTTSGVFDETTYLRISESVYERGNFERLSRIGIAPLPVILPYALPAIVEPDNYRDAITLARVAALLLFGIPVVALTYTWLAREIGRYAASLGAGVVSLSPVFLAHASLAATDVCFVAAALFTIFCLDRFARRPSLRALALVALSLGIAMSSKYSAIGLFPVVALEVFLAAPRSEAHASIRRHLRPALWTLVVVVGLLVVSLCVAWAAHGFDRVTMRNTFFGNTPIPAPLRGLWFQISHASQGHPAFLLGERSTSGWWYYMPVALLVKSTPVELAVFGASLLLLMSGRWKQRPGVRIVVLTSAVFAVLAMRSGVSIGVRHLLLLYPLTVLSGTWYLFAACKRYARVPYLLGVLALATQLSASGLIAPHYLSYFNMWAGGPRQGHNYLVDSNIDWGQDLPALRDVFDDVGAKKPMLCYFGTAPWAPYGLAPVRWPGTEAERESADWFAISVTHLMGVYLDNDPFLSLRDIAPSARAAYSVFLYDLSRTEVQEAVRVALDRHAAPCDRSF